MTLRPVLRRSRKYRAKSSRRTPRKKLHLSRFPAAANMPRMPRMKQARMVAEIQGLYGPFSFSEKLLQKIWLQGDFDRAGAVTTGGRRVQVRHPGKWNFLGGPDFKGARLRFDDGPEAVGDVELHLRADGWAGHGHAADRAYDGVVLHVVLFPPEPGHVTRGGNGQDIPVLVLLPLLHHDLEEFAAEDAVENLANRPLSRVQEELGALPAEELSALLRRQAAKRWQGKVHFARLRVQRLGWEAACHHAALEILGYRFNRAPMLRVAAAWPLGAWARGAAGADAVFAGESGSWSLQGVRPANHPRLRLRQYAAWVQAAPDWPERLGAFKDGLAAIAPELTTASVRRLHQLKARREKIADTVCAGAVGGTRLDNLICDGFLPLLAARTGSDFGGLWFHWYPGDLPPMLTRALRSLGAIDRRAQPACHGAAQGLLGWLLEREGRP